MRKSAIKPRSRGWLILVTLELLAIPVMGLIQVWSGIERTDLNYFINIAQNDMREKMALHAKLAVEKERLLAPYILRQRAEEFGMHEPTPGQVRKLELK